MPRRVSFRIVAITLILLVIVSIAVKANWGSGFGFSLFKANAAEPAASMIDEQAEAPVAPMTTPLNAITSFDAAVLARYIAGTGPMASPAPTEKLAAADTSGNCLISSIDVSNIIGWVTDSTAGGTTNTTINPPGPCANFPISAPVLKGDVTGTGAVITLGSGSATVSLPHITPSPGPITIPIMVTDLTGTDALSYDLQINYDPVALEPATPSVTTDGTLSRGQSVVVNRGNDGHLIISGSVGSMGPGTLLNLHFDFLGLPGQNSALTFADYTGSTGPGSHIHQGCLFNEGLPNCTTINGSVTGPPATPTETGTPKETPTFTATATFTPTPPPGVPYVTNVDRTYSGFFLQGFPGNNVFNANVNWQGTPGTVRFQVDGSTPGTPVDVPGTASGATRTFNMSTAFTPDWSPSIVKITPTNAQGFVGGPWTGPVYVFPYPEWLSIALQNPGGGLTFTTGNGEMKATMNWNYPQNKITSMKCTIPQWVPYIGGELGVKDTSAFIKGSVSSRGTGSLSVGGQTGFKAMGSEIGGNIRGTGKFRINHNGLSLTSATLTFGLRGTIAKELGVVEAIPSLSGLAHIPGVKQFNQTAKLRGEIKPGLVVTSNWKQTPSRHLAFDSLTGTGSLNLKGILKVSLTDRLKVQGWLGGGGSLTLGLPEPYLRSLTISAEAGVKARVDYFIGVANPQYTLQFGCNWTAESGGVTCGQSSRSRKMQFSKPRLSLVRYHYDRFGGYEQFGTEINSDPSMRAGQATVKSTVDPPFLANVYPGAEPKLIPVGSTARMLLWMRQDTNLPILQSTEIAWSYFDGTNWSSPSVILSDTRVEMSPVAGVDENGKVVAAWLRIKDPAFSGTITTFEDLPDFYKNLEVVSAVFDPSLGTWSAVTQLTDDLALDTSLRLSSDSTGKLLLTWQSNPSGEFTANAANPASLKYTFWNGSTWNPVGTVASGLVQLNEHAADVYGTNAFIVAPRDPDLDVTGDRILLVYDWNGSSWSSSSVFAAGGVDNLNPSAAYDAGGQGHVIWLRGSDIVRATLSSPTPQVVRTGGDSMAFFNLQFINNAAGNMTLVWQEASDEGPAKIFAAVYDTVSQTWSSDLRLNDDGDDSQASDSSGYYGTDGKLRLAYLATQINRITKTVTIDGQPVDIPDIPEDGQADLRLLEYTLATDLAVVDDDLALSIENPEADDAMTADLTIHNTGAYPVNNFNVKLFAGDPNTGTLLDTVRVTTQMPGGSDRTIYFAFKYPPSELTFTAVVDSDEEVGEISETNNIAVATITAPSPTPTPPASSLNGVVSYGNAAAPPKFISNVTVTGTGSPNVTTTTDAPGITGGEYTLTGFGSGSYTVSLSKTTGQNGITSNDAARIAQHVSGISVLTNDNQKASADVTGNGAISSQDAAKIAQVVAGLPFSPPNFTNTWRFFLPPGPTFPILTSPTSRTYSSITSNVTGEDYVGLLIGEVTGNWAPTAARPGDRRQETGDKSQEQPITVELPNVVSLADKEIVVPVNVEGIASKGVISYEFDLIYDPSVIQPLGDGVDLQSTASRGLSVVTNSHRPGLLRVVVYGAIPIDENGVLLKLRFTAVGLPGSASPLRIEQLMFNEGEPGVSVTDGRVELVYGG